MIFNSLLISKPTRITSSTTTLIDKIFTNNLEHSMNSGILYTDLSNHLPIFQVIHLKLDAESFRQKRLARPINSATIAAFRSRLETTDWSLIYNSDSTIDSYDTFSSLQHIISHFHLNLYTLNRAFFKTLVFKRSLYPVTGRILFINNSK